MNKAKSPLHYYEIAITELNKVREELQSELEAVKEITSSHQPLKVELENAYSEIQHLQQQLQEKANLKEVEAELANTRSAVKQLTDELKEVKARTIRIESGVFSGNIKETEGWNNNLYGKEGNDRIFKEKIDFKKSFTHPPKVVVGISYADVKKGANHRLRVLAESITVQGFELQIHTWRDTQVWGADVNWLAYGY